MTKEWKPNPEYELDNVQKMGPEKASKLLQVQDQRIHKFKDGMDVGDRVIRSQEQIIQVQQKEIEELKFSLSKFEAIAQKILNFSDRN